MKANRSSIVILGFAVFAVSVVACVAAGKAATKDIATNGDLEAARSKSKPSMQGSGFAPVPEVAETTPKNDAAELMARTVFLTDGKNSVMLPAGAVIHVGERQVEAVSQQTSEHPLMPWQTFINRNGGWVKELQLTADQAMGRAKIDPRIMKRLGNGDYILVTTFAHQPVAAVAGVKEAFVEATTIKK